MRRRRKVWQLAATEDEDRVKLVGAWCYEEAARGYEKREEKEAEEGGRQQRELTLHSCEKA